MKKLSDETFLELSMDDMYAGSPLAGYLYAYGDMSLNPCTRTVDGRYVAPVIQDKAYNDYFIFMTVDYVSYKWTKPINVSKGRYVYFSEGIIPTAYVFDRWMRPCGSIQSTWATKQFKREWFKRKFYWWKK